MTGRAPISKKLRFEVFKRDSFTCQYCGAVGGQVLLHCDHIKPVAEGGETMLLNLITACVDCNLGKGARELSDDSAVAKQHRQLADLEERRQQLEMMRDWREELAQHQVSEIDIVAQAFLARSKFQPNDHGNLSVRRWLRKYGLHEVLAAIDETFDLYFTADTESEWEAAFKRIPRMLAMREQEKVDPHIRKLLYIQGILRRRFDDADGSYVERVRAGLGTYPVDVLEACAKTATSWSNYVDLLSTWLSRQPKATPETQTDGEAVSLVGAEESDVFDESERDHAEDYAAYDDPEFHIDLFAQCLPGKAREFMEVLATVQRGWRGGSVVGDAVGPETVAWLRGLRCVGLIEPHYKHDDIIRIRDDGGIEASFVIPLLTHREASNAFNRHGGLKLSFWKNPKRFARVGDVH